MLKCLLTRTSTNLPASSFTATQGPKLVMQSIMSAQEKLRLISEDATPGITQRILNIPLLFWAFIKSDFFTFTIPNTAFGTLGALAAPILVDDPQPDGVWITTKRVPLALLFNLWMTWIFDLSNQWDPLSVQEDSINKPWRPIPTGKVTSDQARRALLASIPVALAMFYALDVWDEGKMILIITWIYNELRGSSEVVRDPIIGWAFYNFNSASLRIVAGGQPLGPLGVVWTAIISGAILTTMQVQDLKDQAGDSSRGRHTMSLVLGDWTSRVLVAGFVILWSLICAYFWHLAPWAYAVPLSSGIPIALRALFKRTPSEDANTWRLWCFWTVTLYSLPAVSLL